MNATLTFPRALRHPSWYAPLLLAILPTLAAFDGQGVEQINFLFLTGIMLGVGVFLSLGLPAILDRTHALVRKEVEQIRPAWWLGLFASQSGLLGNGGFGRNDHFEIAVVPVTLGFVLVAALSVGIEFQQRTLPSLLCSPLSRNRIWRTKMTVLAVALASMLGVFALSFAASSRPSTPEFGIGVGIIGALGFAAWATVPFWSLITRNLLAGLVFAIAVPPLSLAWLSAVLGSVLSVSGSASEAVLWVVAVGYVVVAPFLAHRRWLRLETPDGTDLDQRGIFLRFRNRTLATSSRTVQVHPIPVLLLKELRLQTVTLACLAAALLLWLSAPWIPAAILSLDVNRLLVGLFAATSTLLAGATAIAEERRLGTLDSQVLLPVSRNLQWALKLAIGAAVLFVATSLILSIATDSHMRTGNSLEFYLQLSMVAVLFVLTFLASSAAPNALKALLWGLAFTGIAVALATTATQLGVESLKDSPQALFEDARANPEPWLARAGALAPGEAEQLHPRFVARITSVFIAACLAAAVLPLLLALNFARRNFHTPGAATRQVFRQFLICLACLVVGAAGLYVLAHRTAIRSNEIEVLRLARLQIDVEARLTPAQLRLRRHLKPTPLEDSPGVLTFRRRTPSGGSLPPALPPSAPAPLPVHVDWRIDVVTLPLDPQARAILVHDADLPEDLREALRLEAVAEGNPRVPSQPGKPPGPWPSDQPPQQPGMSPALMKRYGLNIPTRPGLTGQGPDTAPAPTTTAPASAPYAMSPELMKRYGLLPLTNQAAPSPVPAPTPNTPPTP
jgi:hypothetical protein